MTEILGKYSLIHKIGEGGMAEVFLAVSEDKSYALKKLRQDRSTEENIVADFLREVEIGSKLNHPNLLRIVDNGKIEGTYFAVMEPLLGLSAQQLINDFSASSKCFPLPLSLYIIRETCRALSYIHKISIFDYSNSVLFHGDLSPHNLILTHDGSVKLIDFGSAGQGSSTETGRKRFAKLSYLPADVLRGGSIDMTTDLYSLGVIAFYLLFGVLPFHGNNKFELAEMIRNNLVPKPDTDQILKNPKDEKLIRLFFNRALNKEKKLRFGSSEEFEKAFFQLRFKEQPISDISSANSYYPELFINKLNDMDKEWNDRLNEFQKHGIKESESQTPKTESLLAKINRRHHPRISVQNYGANALVLDTASNNNIELPIHEIGIGGMLLHLKNHPLHVGEEYSSALRLGPFFSPISTTAKMLYKSTRNSNYFAGFQFKNISNQDSASLGNFVQSHLKNLDLVPDKKEEQTAPQKFLDIYFKDFSSFHDEFERNIRHGGMYLESNENVNQEDQVFVHIHLPQTFKRITLKGKVVLVKPLGENKNGIALEIALTKEQLELIQKFI